MVNFLFYIEREFHLSLYKNLITEINRLHLGIIYLYSPEYQESNQFHPNFGIRREEAEKFLGIKINWIENVKECQPAITFIADSTYEQLESAEFIVNIGHGTISKGSFFTDTPLSYRENCADLFCVPGQVHEKIMSAYLYKPLLVSGMPKLDKVFLPSLSKKECLERINLDIDKKTILIAPTFNPEYSLNDLFNYSLIELFLDKYNLIIKLHGITPIEQKNAIVRQVSHYQNARIWNEHEIDIPFVCSDLMISDVSSIGFEFMSMGKPVLLYDSPMRKTQVKYHEKNLENIYRNTFIRFTDFKELDKLISKMIPDKEYAKRMSQIGKRFVSVQDGMSSKLILEESLELFEKRKLKGLIVSDNPILVNKRFFVIQSKDMNHIDLSEEKNHFIQDDMIVFCNGITDRSPNLFDYLKHGLVRNPDKVIVPMIYSQNNCSQNINQIIPETQNMEFEAIKTPLSYRLSGQQKPIQDFDICCFALSYKILLRFLTEIHSDRFSLINLTEWLKLNIQTICLLDCLVRKDQ